jgi:hypothetical protein
MTGVIASVCSGQRLEALLGEKMRPAGCKDRLASLRLAGCVEV